MSDANPMPARVNAAAEARAQRAWSLRVAGFPWGKIAEVVGFHDDATVIRAVRNYAGTIPQPDRDASRQLWRERLEMLWSHARRDVVEQRPGAVRSAVAVAVAQRAAALDALDEPGRFELVTPSNSEVSRVVAELVALRREQLGTSQAEEADPLADEYLDAEVVEGEPGADR